MRADVRRWVKKDGEIFLKQIGIKEGQIILDFGCGEGHYTIPAAKVVGEDGRVYGVDKDSGSLDKLLEEAKSESVKNIVLMKTEDLKLDLKDESIDVVLAYDVIHYIEERRKLFDEIYRVLKKGGLLSVYPKHYKQDQPLWKLADVDLKDVIEEIEGAKFKLERKSYEELMHDDYYNKGYILNFRKDV